MHPSQADGFEWDADNEGELERAQHPVRPYEAEQVFMRGPRWARNKRDGSGEWKMIGYTRGGRALTIILTLTDAGRTIRVITGWDATPAERTKYLNKRQGVVR